MRLAKESYHVFSTQLQKTLNKDRTSPLRAAKSQPDGIQRAGYSS